MFIWMEQAPEENIRRDVKRESLQPWTVKNCIKVEFEFGQLHIYICDVCERGFMSDDTQGFGAH